MVDDLENELHFPYFNYLISSFVLIAHTACHIFVM